MGGHHAKTITAEQVTLPKDAGWRKLPILGGILALVGLGLTVAFAGDHGEAGLYAYLIAFMYFLSLAIGGLFYVMIHYITNSGWGIVNRRLAEAMAATMPVFALLFVPLALNMDHVWAWTSAEALATDPMLQSKAPYLNKGFFLGRAVVYFAILSGLAWFFYLQSLKQDATKDSNDARKIQDLATMVSPVGIAFSTLTMTFIAFDFMMSTDYHWFSTIYGVIYFAGSFMSCFALLAILTVFLRAGGYLGGAVTTEHQHAIGKMMWGLNCFWAYTSFSQFMLIWYANIPEETLWYKHRWEHGWWIFSMILLLGHFALPFFAGMSRHVKRNPKLLVMLSVWLLLMHYLDLFWQIKPNMHHGHGEASIGVAEIAAFVGVGGVFLAAFTALLQRSPLIPVKSPRLPESLAFEEI